MVATGVAPDAQEAADLHTLGTKVWVQDGTDSWVRGEVSRVDGDTLHVVLEGGAQTTCRADEAHIQNPEAAGGVEVRTRLHFGWEGTPQDTPCAKCATIYVQRAACTPHAAGKPASRQGIMFFVLPAMQLRMAVPCMTYCHICQVVATIPSRLQRPCFATVATTTALQPAYRSSTAPRNDDAKFKRGDALPQP